MTPEDLKAMHDAEMAGRDDGVAEADTSDLIARAEAALDGVTPGPWLLAQDEEGPFATCVTAHGFDICTAWGGYNAADADSNFIAAARNLVPELTAALRAAEAALQKADALSCAIQLAIYSPDEIDDDMTDRVDAGLADYRTARAATKRR